VRTAIATVAAYKLGAYGTAPNGRAVVTSEGSDRFPVGKRVVLNRISGHRDTGRTDCPGDALYAQLPAIRAIAGAGPAGLRLLRMTGATRYGSLLFTRGVIKPLWTVGTPSALINRFEVLVDGKLTLAAPGAHRAAVLRLAPGGHTVMVRALHLSGRSTTVSTKVVSDATAPVFTGRPDVVLRPGSLNGSVPIRLQWTATDVNGLASVGLLRPSTVDLGATAHGRNGSVAPGRPATFTLRATDRAGNAASASVTRTPVVVSEAATQRTGVWRVLRGSSYLGGVGLGASAAGATATWSFTGRSAALAVSRGALSGRIRIWVDGNDHGVVDLRSANTLDRQAIWARSWSTSAEHTVRVQVEGTTGRPGVVLDGLVYLR
ncbi:MAG TPA: N-acetylmuramoyl-L-alanine amidase, partial [Actinoplanes sp.]